MFILSIGDYDISLNKVDWRFRSKGPQKTDEAGTASVARHAIPDEKIRRSDSPAERTRLSQLRRQALLLRAAYTYREQGQDHLHFITGENIRTRRVCSHSQERPKLRLYITG